MNILGIQLFPIFLFYPIKISAFDKSEIYNCYKHGDLREKNLCGLF